MINKKDVRDSLPPLSSVESLAPQEIRSKNVNSSYHFLAGEFTLT